MKKRILSSLLMGALFVASMSTFTSCKDYDDDINSNKSDIAALQSQVTALETAKTNLESQLSTLTAASATHETQAAHAADIAALQTKIDNINTAIQGCNDAISGNAVKIDTLAARILSISTDLNRLNATLNDPTTGWKAVDDNLQSQINANNTYIAILKSFGANATSAQDSINKLNATLKSTAAMAEANKTVLDSLKSAMATANTSVNKISTRLNILEVYVEKAITSIVAEPKAYYQMIAAVDAYGYTVDSLVMTPATNVADGADAFAAASQKTTFVPDFLAYYNINPTSSDINKYNFVGKVVNATNTRAAKAPTSFAVDSIYGAAGFYAVKYTMTNDEFDYITPIGVSATDQVTTVALKATYKDTLSSGAHPAVVSDYSVVKKNTISAVDVFQAQRTNPATIVDMTDATIPETAKTIYNLASTEERVIYVPYDASTDVKSLIYANLTIGGTAKNVKLSDLDQYGLKAVVTVADYYTAKDANTANNITVSGTTVSPKTATVASVGKKGLLRVTLVSLKNNAVVGYGFAQALITMKAQNTTVSFDTAFGISCTKDAKLNTGTNVKYTDFASALNSVFGVTDFSSVYTPEMTGSNYNLYYLDGTTYKAASTTNTADTYYGTLKKPADLTTGSIEWKLNKQAEINLLYTKNTDGTYSPSGSVKDVYIKLTSTAAGYASPYYVKITLDKSKVTFPAVTFDDSKKLSAKWYAAASTSAGTAEVHEVVSEPGSTNTAAWDIKLDNDFANANAFASNTESGVDFEHAYYFITNADKNKYAIGHSGAKYFIAAGNNIKNMATADKDSTILYAYKYNDGSANISGKETTWAKAVAVAGGTGWVKVAEITSATTGAITLENTNATFKDLLNYGDHKELAKSFLATIGMEVQFCDPSITIATSGSNEFDVRFLRPLSSTTGNDKSAIDAADNGSLFFNYDLVSLTDYRDQAFKTASPNYFTHYGVTGIAIDKTAFENCMTDITAGGVAQTVKQANILSRFTFIPGTDAGMVTLSSNAAYIVYATTADDLHKTNGTTVAGSGLAAGFGAIYYNNAGTGAIRKFVIKDVPVKVTYLWGEITQNVTMTIGSTLNNAKKN